ncbi:bifunctional diguanylate cyclase/phosphodiesterase [Sulfurivirga sp.]|uniref:putative bifunctional diguanylate cyclase/phosphodiesterase n=1 Tax=Sulfurivirga sp. TaxID=2614236 RepID=UPI0025F95697|nr:GGDEF domain-containing protein [Sulfurivirga sp.]
MTRARSEKLTDLTTSDVLTELLQWQQAMVEQMLNQADRQAVLKHICQRMEERVPGAQAMVLMHRPSRNALEVMVAGRLDRVAQRRFQHLFNDADHCICSRTLREGTPLFIEDIHHDSRWSKVRNIDELRMLGACWAEPILGEGAVIGVLFLAFDAPAAATAEGRAVLRQGAQLASLALRQAELSQRVRQLTEQDPLTLLYNREKLKRDVNALFQRGTPFGCIQIDVDLFKEVNDAYGHPMGDAMLVELARRLERVLIDFPGRLYRFGGDEFVIITQVCEMDNPRARMEALCETLVRQAGETLELDGILFNPSISLGISCGEEAKGDYNELMRMADAALAAAKSAGRGTWRFFEPGMVTELKESLRVASMLRAALADRTSNQLDVHYQPILNATTGSVETFEALIRWTHPDEGSIPPFKFVPVAEKNGLIRELDERVLEIVLADLKQWQAQLPVLDFTVALNLSAQEFERQHVERLVRKIHDSGLASHLEFEITESIMMSNTEETIALLDMIRKTGVAALAMDDFGTGYSSMGYLKRFPVNKLKIDQSLVRDIDTDTQDRAIARAVAALGRELSLKVVAEGVETDTHRQLLAGQGIDLLQGYLFARPMPGEAVVPWLSAHNRQCQLLPG